MNVGLSPLYQLEAAQLAQSSVQTAEIPLEEVSKAISKIQDYTYDFGTLTWACILAVKFCYLYFFRLLIDRQRAMVLYWKIAVGVTAVAFVFNACASFISCSEFGQQDRKPFFTKCILKTLNVPLTSRLRSALR